MSFGSSLLPLWLGMRPRGRQKATNGTPLKQEESRFWTTKFSGPRFIPVLFTLAPQGCHSYRWSLRYHGLLSKHSRCWQQQGMEEGRHVFSRIFTQLKMPAMKIHFLEERSLWLTLSISFVRKKAKRASLAACRSSRKPSVCL